MHGWVLILALVLAGSAVANPLEIGDGIWTISDSGRNLSSTRDGVLKEGIEKCRTLNAKFELVDEQHDAESKHSAFVNRSYGFGHTKVTHTVIITFKCSLTTVLPPAKPEQPTRPAV